MAQQRSWLKWLGLGCGGLIVVVGIILVIVFVVVGSMTAEPERAAKEFLGAAASGDYARAHSYFSAPLKEKQSLEAFSEIVRSSPSLFSVTDTTFSERSIDTAGAKLAGTATLKAGTRVPVSFSLVKENNEWKLIAYNIGSKEE